MSADKNYFSVNDYLIAKMMRENHTNKVIIAADIRGKIGCYRQGAMGNYATAFSVVVKKETRDVVSLAKQIAAYVADVMKEPRKQLLILACYLHLRPELIDAATIATLGNFESKAGVLPGKRCLGMVRGTDIVLQILEKSRVMSLRKQFLFLLHRLPIKKSGAF